MKNWIFVVTCFLLLTTAMGTRAGHYHHENPRDLKMEITIIDEYGYRLPLYDVQGGYLLKKSYMQALRGQEYAIEVGNKTNKRVGFVIAVDGRNIITGKPSYLKSHEKMYILDPFEVSTFRGWRSSGNTVNRFYFTNENDSYSGAFNDHSAMGVIAVAAFYEKPRYHPPHNKGDKHSAKNPNGSPSLRSDAGTGWGDTEYSPTSKVRFVAQKKPFAKHLIKYEWHQKLCEMGIVHCNGHRYSNNRGNRLWDDGEYAPPPPRRSRSRVGF